MAEQLPNLHRLAGRRREEGEATGVIALPTTPGQVIPVVGPQPVLPVTPQTLPGFLKQRNTYSPQVWDVLPKQIVETDTYGNELTFERGEGGVETLRKMTMNRTYDAKTNVFPGATVEFAGGANEEYPTRWEWTGESAGYNFVEFGGSSRDSLYTKKASFTREVEKRIDSLWKSQDESFFALAPPDFAYKMDRMEIIGKYMLSARLSIRILVESLQSMTRGERRKVYKDMEAARSHQSFARMTLDAGRVQTEITFPSVMTIVMPEIDAATWTPVDTGTLPLVLTVVYKEGGAVHSYRLMENGDVVYDPLTSSGPPPKNTLYIAEDVYTAEDRREKLFAEDERFWKKVAEDARYWKDLRARWLDPYMWMSHAPLVIWLGTMRALQRRGYL